MSYRPIQFALVLGAILNTPFEVQSDPPAVIVAPYRLIAGELGLAGGTVSGVSPTPPEVLR
jgi:hypothetical protein